jgi:tetratricopeptide (TPR) repeat protein
VDYIWVNDYGSGRSLKVGEFKQKLLDLVDWAYQEEKILLDKLTDKERAEIGTINKWSAKGIIAHIAFWKSLRAKSINDVLKGETLKDIGDFNKINEEVFKKFENHYWDDIINYSREAHNYLKKTVESSSEEDLNSRKSFPLLGDKEIWKIIVIYCCLHPLDHFDKYYDNRNQTYYAINLWKEALDLLEQLPASSGIIGNAKYNLARYYALSGQKFIAVRTLNQSFQFNPNLIKRSIEDPDLSSIKGQLEK